MHKNFILGGLSNIPFYVYSLIHWWTFGLFLLFSWMLIWIFIYVFIWTYGFNYLPKTYLEEWHCWVTWPLYVSLLKNCQKVFHSGLAIWLLHFYQQCMRVPISIHPTHTFYCLEFLVLDKWLWGISFWLWFAFHCILMMLNLFLMFFFGHCVPFLRNIYFFLFFKVKREH
jgi:hypothetical protein